MIAATGPGTRNGQLESQQPHAGRVQSSTSGLASAGSSKFHPGKSGGFMPSVAVLRTLPSAAPCVITPMQGGKQ